MVLGTVQEAYQCMLDDEKEEGAGLVIWKDPPSMQRPFSIYLHYLV